jgi:uncharacterized repeat protein (TIGR04052 family)
MMRMMLKGWPLATPLLLALALSGCATPPPTKGDQTISLRFALDAACGRDITGLAPVPVQLRDARLYVSELALIDKNGQAVPITLDQNVWQHQGTALLDFEDATAGCTGTPERNDRITGKVPAGDYRGVAFTIGVPGPLNHGPYEKAPAPLDLTAMGWGWQAGRKFIKIELLPQGGTQRPNGAPTTAWNLHLGSSGCAGDPIKGEAVTCASSNRIPVRLDRFNPMRDMVDIDLQALFAGTNVTRDGGGAVGCMSGPADPDCTAIFKAMGLRLTASAPGAGDAGQPLPEGQRFVKQARR